ncbi:MAG: WG repeat-containing protein [Elusimicrobiales bacterium]
MKRYLCFAAVCLLLTGAAARAAASALPLARIGAEAAAGIKEKATGRQLTVAVLDFPYYDNKLTLASAQIGEALTMALAANGVSVAERRLIASVLKEKRLQLSGLLSESAAGDIGQLTGCNAVLTGTVEDLDDGVSKLNLRLVDAGTGLLLFAGEYTARRTWERRAAPQAFDGKVGGDITFETAQQGVPQALPERPAGAGLDFSGVDIALLEKQDGLLKLEKTAAEYPDLLSLAEGWDEIAAAAPQYREQAASRAARWRDYAESELRRDDERAARALAMDGDYARLARLLVLDSVAAPKKAEFARKFLDAYGYAGKYAARVQNYLERPCVDKGRVGFCYADGSVAIPGRYDFALDFTEGLALVRLGNKRGYVDHAGNEVIKPARYSLAGQFSDGLAQVKRGDKFGYIDRAGRLAIEPVYDDARAFSEGLAPVRLGAKWGYIDGKGRQAAPFKYDKAGRLNDGAAIVSINGKYGLLGPGGVELAPLRYDVIDEFSEGLAAFAAGGKCGYLSLRGKEAVPARYDRADAFSEGLAFVMYGGKWAFINPGGDETVAFCPTGRREDYVGEERLPGLKAYAARLLSATQPITFSGGLAPMLLVEDLGNPGDAAWGFIGADGEAPVRPRFLQAGPFAGDFAVVTNAEHKSNLLRRDGTLLFDKWPDAVTRTADGTYWVKSDGAYTYYDREGRKITALTEAGLPTPLYGTGLAVGAVSGKPGNGKRDVSDAWGRRCTVEY